MQGRLQGRYWAAECRVDYRGGMGAAECRVDYRCGMGAAEWRVDYRGGMDVMDVITSFASLYTNVVKLMTIQI